ncbi:hypothetical protein BH09MYX1_BH09MYX1_06050 [soil metagenome]
MYTLIGLWVLGKRANQSPHLKKVLGVTRVLGYGLAVTAVITGVAARNAVADVGNEGLRIGHDLDKLGDLLGDTQQLTLNQQNIFFSQAVSHDGTAAVLDKFETNCNQDSAISGADWQDIADAKLAPTKVDHGFLHIGTVRKEEPDGKGGMVLCFKRPPGATQKSFTDAMQEFHDTGDFAALGFLRYVHVSTSDGETKVQTIWTNGSFNVNKLLPPADGGDTVGSDSPTMPRPNNGQRILTATATGTPYAVRMYVTGQAQAAVLDSYDQEMTNRGWAIIEPPSADKLDGHWYERDGAQAMVSLGTNDAGKTVVTLGDLGETDKGPKGKVQE